MCVRRISRVSSYGSVPLRSNGFERRVDGNVHFRASLLPLERAASQGCGRHAETGIALSRRHLSAVGEQGVAKMSTSFLSPLGISDALPALGRPAQHQSCHLARLGMAHRFSWHRIPLPMVSRKCLKIADDEWLLAIWSSKKLVKNHS